MKISLKEWRQICAARDAAAESLDKLHMLLMELMWKYKEGDAECKLLNKWVMQLRESSLPYDTHPQSEWTGGDSSNPANHKLREPNCVGLRRRYFTAEEIAEAGVECLGPCDWVERGKPDDKAV